MLFIALSWGKHKKAALRCNLLWLLIAFCVFPYYSSALRDGYCGVLFLGEPSQHVARSNRQALLLPSFFRHLFSRAKRPYLNNLDIHAPLDWDWSPGNRRVSRLNVKALRTLVVVLRRSATAHADHLCSTVKTTKRRSPLSPKNNRFAPSPFFLLPSPSPFSSLFSLLLLLACVSSSPSPGNRIHVVYASVPFSFVINKNDQKKWVL